MDRRRYMDANQALAFFEAMQDDEYSGEESFLTDEELHYQDGLDPAEDRDNEEDTSPPTQARQESSDSSAVEGPSTSAAAPQPSTSAAAPQQLPGLGWLQSRSRGRASSRSRSGSLRGQQSPESTRSRSRSPQPAAPTPSWNSESQPDIPPVPTSTPLDLFKLFVSDSAATTLCNNTNTNAAKNVASGKKCSWKNFTVEEFFKYLGLTFFFALVRLTNIQDYWRTNTIFSQQFPHSVMARDRYQVISWNIHMSDPDEDVYNDRKRGTPAYDRLFRLKPLLDDIKYACRAFYHPRQNLSLDERMVATKSHTGMTQYMKAKPTKWGFKLFVLADSSIGYTLDFAVYRGKSVFVSGVGLAYDSVMSLMNKSSLGSGYNVYVDNFYSSPKLFMDLYSMNFGACGTYRDNRRGCPCTTTNSMTKKDPRGTIRWIRDNPLVFVKWMDTREVSVCSTIHPAFSGNTVQRRVRTQDGGWDTKSIPCPTPVTEYNKHMGSVGLSDQLIQYYSVHHKTMRWYRTLFYHFLDIAATNSYLLHKKQQRSSNSP
ncbi:piggyBac transposable element-derived protein 3-like [Tachysurus fulvidraco]|uniref:piggyBac transposable element-derived protein 3-like n=1 Tax=Tachysurus fulvidraco TaxID=1234273 RepID=UPI001FF03F47|nr:piggyBac transposable element-derived protein 3-like [Tachysurus fulvidraco]